MHLQAILVIRDNGHKLALKVDTRSRLSVIWLFFSFLLQMMALEVCLLFQDLTRLL